MSFHTRFEYDKHDGLSDLEITLHYQHYQADSVENLRRRESFW